MEYSFYNNLNNIFLLSNQCIFFFIFSYEKENYIKLLMNRISARNRKSEKLIEVNYIEKLYLQYKNYIDMKKAENEKVIIIDPFFLIKKI